MHEVSLFLFAIPDAVFYALCPVFLLHFGGLYLMEMSALFLINSLLLGIGLAMDAFSVSLVDGLNNPRMGLKKSVNIALIFAVFQALMPLTGWLLTHTMLRYFGFLQKVVPVISLLLLLFIGGNMIFGDCSQDESCSAVTLTALLVQGAATSIDALSVGLTIAEYSGFPALLCALIIASVTFCICFIGVQLGKKAGCRFSGRAEILGGLVLIAIGIEIFLTHL